MAFTVAEVIAGARAWHPSFDENVHGDTVAFDWISSFARIERRKLQSLVPEMLLNQMTIAMPPTGPFSDGVPLVAGVETVFAAHALYQLNPPIRGEPISLVPLEHIQDPGPWPALVYVAQPINRVYFKGNEDDWVNFAGVLLEFVPAPVPVTALTDAIVLPDAYFDVCIAGLATFFAMRSGSERIGPAQFSFFSSREAEVRAVADAALASQRAGEVWRIRELI